MVLALNWFDPSILIKLYIWVMLFRNRSDIMLDKLVCGFTYVSQVSNHVSRTFFKIKSWRIITLIGTSWLMLVKMIALMQQLVSSRTGKIWRFLANLVFCADTGLTLGQVGSVQFLNVCFQDNIFNASGVHCINRTATISWLVRFQKL